MNSLVRERKYEGLRISLVLRGRNMTSFTLLERPPWDWCETSKYLIVLTLDYGESRRYSIAKAMKRLGWESILWPSVYFHSFTSSFYWIWYQDHSLISGSLMYLDVFLHKVGKFRRIRAFKLLIICLRIYNRNNYISLILFFFWLLFHDFRFGRQAEEYKHLILFTLHHGLHMLD